MEQQPEALEPTPEQPPVAPARTPAFSTNEVLFIFLASMLIGIIGALTGFVPLVALAMVGPIVAAMLA